MTNYNFQSTDGIRFGILNVSSDGVYHTHCFENLKSEFNGSEFSAEIAISKCSFYLGFSISSALLIFQIMNIPMDKIVFVPVNHSTYGSLVNGTWIGALKDIDEGLYDTTYPEFTPLVERLEITQFSSPLTGPDVMMSTR